MRNYLDMREMARGATETYRHIDSLEGIRPPYPARGTPNWWALRIRYEELLFSKIRRQRAESKLALPEKPDQANAAKWSALGNEAADADYQRLAFRR